jgi:glutathione peroxidase-family protein
VHQTSTWVSLVFLCGLALAGGSYFYRDGVADDPREIEGLDLDGAEMKLSDYRGKVVLLTFWADQAGEWRKLNAYQKRLLRRHEGEPFVVLGVNADKSRQAAQAAAERLGATWPSWHDGPDGPIAQAFDVTELPTFFLIDHRGEVCDRYDSFLLEEEIEPLVDQLVLEAKRRKRR